MEHSFTKCSFTRVLGEQIPKKFNCIICYSHLQRQSDPQERNSKNEIKSEQENQDNYVNNQSKQKDSKSKPRGECALREISD